ncbi:MAG: family 78 glycoside hydrolase catalytic domain [Bacteroidota bacterium]
MLQPEHLRTEFRSNPLGIDHPNPRLSWTLKADIRGERQTAYRILVASSPEWLARDQGDLWDTGKTHGSETSLIRYEGEPLSSHTECCWKVMAWDKENRPGPWSGLAEWSMGMLDPDDWHADWIGYDVPRKDEKKIPAVTAQWIWLADDPVTDVPAGKRYFAHVFEIQTGKSIRRADLMLTADDSYRLFINGTEASESPPAIDSWKTPQLHEVSSMLPLGKNVLYVEAVNEGKGPAGFILWLSILFTDGTRQTVGTNPEWISSAKQFPRWKTEGPGKGEGSRSGFRGHFGVAPWLLLDESMLLLPPPRYLQSDLKIDKPIARAVLYASALGLCDLYVNGSHVSDEYFTPGWTDYPRRVYYRTYDVTDMLRSGENTWGAILADGWYSGYLGWAVQRDRYGSRTRLKAQIYVEYSDGSREVIGTGSDWRAFRGPLQEADFLMGETYDARVEGPTGNVSGKAKGDLVDLGADIDPLLQAHPGPPVRKFAELPPQSITEPEKGAYVFDMGRNFAGVVRLKTRGEPGQRIRLRFAERLNPDGTFYVQNLRGARAVDTYVCRGKGEEVWEPRFTFHGFQYVEVTGLTSQPNMRTITGLAISSDTPVVGDFQCSEEMLNQLYSNVLWTQRANFIEVPTDCPQRDERLGWTGDAQVFIPAACLNTDVQAFFHKWLVDLTDSQRKDGQFPMVAPLIVADDDGGPAWADAGVICPWTIYKAYGDTSILGGHYEAMKRFVEFCRGRSTEELLPPPEYHSFGDWLHIQAETPTDVLYMAYFARSTQLLALTAEVLGKTEDAARYGELYQEIRAAFNSAYVSETGSVLGETQTAYALAISFGLLDDEDTYLAAERLVTNIEKRDWCLSTGFVGTLELMHALARIGRYDVAYRLLLNEKFPSWGHTIKNGATSIWERWDGWTPEKGFQSTEMNSFAHYAFGAVYQWMAENIGGIKSDGAGYRRILIAPEPGPTLSSARVSYRSVRGLIQSEWKKEQGRFFLNVDVPANTEATVHLPAVEGSVTESGKPVAEQKDVNYSGRSKRKRETFVVGGGHYEFACEFRDS